MSRITRVAVSAHTIPTESPESDGTLEWSSTTIVIVEVSVGDVSGVVAMTKAVRSQGPYAAAFAESGVAWFEEPVSSDDLEGLLFVRDHALVRMDIAAGPLSSHTASAIHLHPCCALARARHLEHFHDHVRIERLLFDGVIEPVDGMMTPDLSRSGLGLTLKRADALRYAA